MSRSINLAVIPGDGIGQEVVAEGLKVLSAVLPQDVKLETKDFDFGARRYRATDDNHTYEVTTGKGTRLTAKGINSAKVLAGKDGTYRKK